jgi:hypothetical protein
VFVITQGTFDFFILFEITYTRKTIQGVGSSIDSSIKELKFIKIHKNARILKNKLLMRKSFRNYFEVFLNRIFSALSVNHRISYYWYQPKCFDWPQVIRLNSVSAVSFRNTECSVKPSNEVYDIVIVFRYEFILGGRQTWSYWKNQHRYRGEENIVLGTEGSFLRHDTCWR